MTQELSGFESEDSHIVFEIREACQCCLEEWKDTEAFGLIICLVSRVSSQLFVGDDLRRDMKWLNAPRGWPWRSIQQLQLLTNGMVHRKCVQVNHTVSNLSAVDGAIRRSSCAVCLDGEISSRWHGPRRRETRQFAPIDG